MNLRFGFVVILVTTMFGAGFNTQESLGQRNYPPPRPNTAAGGVFGGASGSLIGAAIGSNEGKSGEGALIGGIIGAAAGGILGNQVDKANELRGYHYQQRQAQQYQRRISQAVSLSQVVQMSQSGLSDSVIANQIRQNGVASLPTSEDLIWLKQNGVSDHVLSALQNANRASAPNMAPGVPTYSSPRVYHERIIVHPAPVYHVPHFHAPPGYYYPPRVGHRSYSGSSAHLRLRF